MIEEEKFYTLNGYEGYFEINKKGVVKSVSRFVNSKNGSKRLIKSNIIKPHLHRDGYIQVSLSVREINKRYPKQLHRLLALTFIPNPMNFPCVNHIDGNKLNNDLSNLEWCTISYNSQHYYDLGYKTPNRNLTSKDAVEIRLEYSKHKGLQKEFKESMSKKYNVSKYVIHDIILNRSYKNTSDYVVNNVW